jgi:hypothetical protein
MIIKAILKSGRRSRSLLAVGNRSNREKIMIPLHAVADDPLALVVSGEPVLAILGHTEVTQIDVEEKIDQIVATNVAAGFDQSYFPLPDSEV